MNVQNVSIKCVYKTVCKNKKTDTKRSLQPSKKRCNRTFLREKENQSVKKFAKREKRNKTPVSCILKQYPFVDVRRESVWTAWDFLFHFGIEMRWKTLIS